MPSPKSSYNEAETRFERWLNKYQSDRTAHEKARSAHPDPEALDAHLATVVKAMDLTRCHDKPAELARATDVLVSGARASPLHFQDYELSSCSLGDLVDVLETQADVQRRGCKRRVVPELGLFLDALTGSGSAAVLTNKRYIGMGGMPLPYFVLQSVVIGQPWGYFRAPVPDDIGSAEDCTLRRVCLRFLARMAFLSAERDLGQGGIHPFAALLGVGLGETPQRALHPLDELATRYLDYPINRAAVLQVVYLMAFVYRAFPWPRRQHLADSEYAEWARSTGWSPVSDLTAKAMEIAVNVPGVFEVFLDEDLEHLLLPPNGDFGLAPCALKHKGWRGAAFAWNRFFKDRREEAKLAAMLRNNRRFSAWVCGAGRGLLLDTCRQRRRRVVEAVAQGAPYEFAVAAPDLLAFVRGPGVRGKKDHLVAWLETKLEDPASQGDLSSTTLRKRPVYP